MKLEIQKIIIVKIKKKIRNIEEKKDIFKYFDKILLNIFFKLFIINYNNFVN